MAREFFGGRIVLGLRTEERQRGIGAPTLRPPTREAPPTPTEDQPLTEAVIDGIIRTRKIDEQPKKPNKIRVLISRGIMAGIVLTGVGLGINKIRSDNEPTPQTSSADFPNSFTNKEGPALVEIKKVNPDEIFDPNATSGVKSERNTIRMTREEYQKIAPPVIDRENRKEIHGEFTIYGTDRVRKLTLEQGTSINALIYIKTPDGKIRETTYTKVSNPGEVTGRYPFPMTAPNCTEYLGTEQEIQAGDIFPAPISGDVYYTAPTYYNYYNGKKIEKGSFVYASYAIIGEYIDKEGNKFMVRAGINTLGASGSAITKPLVPDMSNSQDLVKKITIKNPSGIEEIEHQVPSEDKIPKVRVEQGEDLFKFITQPPFQRFSNASNMKAQLNVGLSYSDIDANGVANSFGGENCVHPTVDNRAVVLIQ